MKMFRKASWPKKQVKKNNTLDLTFVKFQTFPCYPQGPNKSASLSVSGFASFVLGLTL